MKYTKLTMFAAAAALAASSVQAQPPVDHVSIECNWGTLTMTSIEEDGGKKMGEHASDPSGDGKGRGDGDQPRAGLANVVNPGDLQATCEFIESLLED